MMTKFTMAAAAALALVWAAQASAAETQVELKNVHMCCGGCAKEVTATLKKVEGVSGATCDQETNTAKFTAADAKAAQKALDALAAKGFHGRTDSKDYAFKDDSGVKAGKVKSLTVTGFHNSCGGCVESFRGAIKDVKGVAGDDARAKVTTAEVTGDFDAAELVKALNKAGFHVKVKQ